MSFLLQSWYASQVWRPCGCRRGFFLCGEARVLWAAVNAAYHAAALKGKFGDWPIYAEAVAAYEAHFGTESSSDDKYSQDSTIPMKQ